MAPDYRTTRFLCTRGADSVRRAAQESILTTDEKYCDSIPGVLLWVASLSGLFGRSALHYFCSMTKNDTALRECVQFMHACGRAASFRWQHNLFFALPVSITWLTGLFIPRVAFCYGKYE